MKIAFTLPLRTVSLTNAREHWRKRAARAKAERLAVGVVWFCHPHTGDARAMVRYGNACALVRLTRVGPRSLDSDNLASSCKHVRDEIAARLGIDDGSPRIQWLYSQEKGPYEVRVEISVFDSLNATNSTVQP